jgi:hypothetical protein
MPATLPLQAAAAGRHRFLALESLRERNGWMLCAKRRPRVELSARFPSCGFDHLHTEEDVSWTPKLEAEEECAERGYQALACLMRRRGRGAKILFWRRLAMLFIFPTPPPWLASSSHCKPAKKKLARALPRLWPKRYDCL